MIIDFHTHMFPDKIAARTIDFLSKTGGDMNPFTDGTWKGLKESAKQAGIDHSIVLPIATRPGQFHTINEFATHFQEGTLISFGSLHPESENYKEELRQIQDMGMKGIKLHPVLQIHLLQHYNSTLTCFTYPADHSLLSLCQTITSCSCIIILIFSGSSSDNNQRYIIITCAIQHLLSNFHLFLAPRHTTPSLPFIKRIFFNPICIDFHQLLIQMNFGT